MAGYYYLGAQLPILFFEREPLISLEDFVAEAGKWLDGTDLRALDAAALDETDPAPGRPVVLERVLEFERDLRGDIEAYRRSVKAGQDYKPVHFPASLVKEGNPLEVEKKLLRLRWDLLSELEVGHFFDIEFVLIYRLKLQILRRLFLFDKPRGVQAFQQLCEVTI